MEITLEMHQHKMETAMKEWGARLDALKARIDKASAQAKTELSQQADELGKLQDAGKKHLDELRASSKEAWNGMKSDMETRWDHLSASMESLWAKVAN